MKIQNAFLLTFGLALLVCGANVSAQTIDPNYLDGELYLKLQDSSSLNLDPYTNNVPALNLIFATHGVDTIYRPFRSGHPALQQIYRLHFSNLAGTAVLLSDLELLGFVDYAERIPLNRPVEGALFIPNDLVAAQWGLNMIDAPLAWDLAQGSAMVKVAVVDNAHRLSHEDLTGAIWTNPIDQPGNLLDEDLNGYADDAHGYDVGDLDPNAAPPALQTGWDHGSHCSGIVGASTDNGLGIASIGYGVSVIPVKATKDLAGGNTLTNAFEGVDYARSAGADIISMSWGSLGSSLTGDVVLGLAANAGILLVAAAGNNGDSVPFYPAANSLCLAVGATDQQDHRSGFSNYGSYIDVMAPGSDIYSCLATSDVAYGNLSGTSMACPLVAGLAGLLLSHDPSYTSTQLRDLIIRGCENIDGLNPGFEGTLGAGRINAHNSLVATSSLSVTMEGEVSLAPNPCAGSLQVYLPASWQGQAVQCMILDLQGRVVMETGLIGPRTSLDLGGLSSGVYCLRLSVGQERCSKLFQRL